MSMFKMFIIALRIWLVFAAASICTSMIIIVGLSLIGLILGILSNPVSLISTTLIFFGLYKIGLINPEKIRKFFGWIRSAYVFLWSQIKPIFVEPENGLAK